MLYQLRKRKLNKDLIVEHFYDDENLERNPDVISAVFYEYNRSKYGRSSDINFFVAQLINQIFKKLRILK